MFKIISIKIKFILNDKPYQIGNQMNTIVSKCKYFFNDKINHYHEKVKSITEQNFSAQLEKNIFLTKEMFLLFRP